MEQPDTRRHETEALIEAIWGPEAVRAPPAPDPDLRARQNQALAAALKDYLQQYLSEV